MIQVLGVMLVMGGASWLGFQAAHQMDRQWKDLSATVEALNFLSRELEWDNPPLPELLDRAGQRFDGPMREIAKKLRQSLEHLDETALLESWGVLVKEEQRFAPGVRDALLPLGGALGKCGCAELRQAIEKTRRHLEEIQRELLNERKQKGKLYRILGISGGSFLALLLL